jgi:hypothetical protein
MHASSPHIFFARLFKRGLNETGHPITRVLIKKNTELCSAQTVARIGLLEEIPRSGVQIPCLS